MTTFVVPAAAYRVKGVRSGRLSDVDASIDGLKNGAGFLLYVTDGRLESLEGYTYDEPWPEVVSGLHLTYTEGETRNLTGLED